MIDFEIKPEQMNIEQLGPARIDNPTLKGNVGCFVHETDRVLYEDVIDRTTDSASTLVTQVSMERAGPREKIYFDPSKTRAGIVTCGGLCPGINDVIRAVTIALSRIYGVRHIYGFRYGYEGFIAKYGHDVIELNSEVVDGWQETGGTKLGSSRGPQPAPDIVDCLERMGINILFVVGGDGTLRGGADIYDEVKKRNLKISVIGIPKTIDNDLMFIDESFGFQTAYEAAVQSLICAHIEAKGAYNGVGLVKLMGRHSGFIACSAALAMSDVNFVLIPEVPFTLEGENGFLGALHRRLEARHHAVVVVAEGAGQEFMDAVNTTDASGNMKLQDVGVFLRDAISDYMKKKDVSHSVKYIDPSYIIRSVPANAADGVYCLQLGHDAVHAAMAGKTNLVVGRWHGLNVHIPIKVATIRRKIVDPTRPLWRSVLESTGQMKWFNAR
ncbi:MAG: ATP-dependent 6-phosphofructokinase [Fibrobacterota bacterium]|jgi:6-phosphofructokinase 1|nr:ATP-dependent 6-phosphofructokinase [Chitinispirillaceae bacterium]